MITRKAFAQISEILLNGGAKRATKYFSDKLVLKGTLKTFKRGGSSRIKELLFTIGGPNYAERKFIKKALKAGEPFPIKKIQIKWLSK